MAATGKTPILLYGSTTATNAPVAGNLTNNSDGCEIAINVADKNLFFKDSTNVVNTVPIRQSSASSNGWLSSTDWSTFNGKQAALVSGTNIKTVGGVNLLGSGDIGTLGVAYGGSGEARFNLPYTAAGTPGAYGAGPVSTATGVTIDAGRTFIAMQPTSGTAYARLIEIGSAASSPALSISNFSTGAGSLVYTCTFKV